LGRRILVGVLLVACLAISIAAGVVAAEWPFWKRVFTLPADSGEWPESYYQPVSVIDGGGGPFFPIAGAAEVTIEPQALEAAAQWAEANNSVALLVLHRGKVQLERYWQGMSADQLFSGRAMTRSLIGLTYGFALEEGAIASLDQPASTDLHEWRGDPRGAITVRQLMHNVSGLEEASLNAAPPGAGFFTRLASLMGKSARLSLGTDFTAAALSFELQYPPGTRFAFSNANPQLLGVILERATGRGYERYVEEKIWRPIGAGRAELYMDRRNGMPAVYCCFRATPRDFLRFAALLAHDGTHAGKRVLPQGWIAELMHTSKVNPLYGLQVWAGHAQSGLREYLPGSGQGVTHAEGFLTDMIWMEGGGSRTIWVAPAEQLVVVRLGRASKTWDGSVLPNTILRGVRAVSAERETGSPAAAVAGG
jgi:CubicO group peptidase (beta-lactamase class C family)